MKYEQKLLGMPDNLLLEEEKKYESKRKWHFYKMKAYLVVPLAGTFYLIGKQIDVDLQKPEQIIKEIDQTKIELRLEKNNLVALENLLAVSDLGNQFISGDLRNNLIGKKDSILHKVNYLENNNDSLSNIDEYKAYEQKISSVKNDVFKIIFGGIGVSLMCFSYSYINDPRKKLQLINEEKEKRGMWIKNKKDDVYKN